MVTFSKFKLATICIVASLLLSFTKDENPFLAILKKIDEFSKKYPQEKVYLQLDKPYYSIGDDIWFKCYVINASNNKPSNISSVLYAELINDRDSLIKRHKLPLANGIGWADFALPDSLPDGNYRIRAYTNWMRNFDNDFFFEKNLKIGKTLDNEFKTISSYSFDKGNIIAKVKLSDKINNPYIGKSINYTLFQKGIALSKGKVKTDASGNAVLIMENKLDSSYKNARIEFSANVASGTVTKSIALVEFSKTVDIQFMPEGGHLITDIPSKIAYKAINSSGKGEDVKINILNSKAEKIDETESIHLGMGYFTLVPLKNEEYFAEVKFKDGSTKKIKLPKGTQSGYSISTKKLINDIEVRISLSNDLINKGELNLIAQHGNKIYHAVKISPNNQIVKINIPTTDFPSGILNLTLFDPTNNPIAERLVFINNKSNNITINQEQPFNSSRKKGLVTLKLNATNDNNPIAGSFSVAVNNINKIDVDEENESNIFTSLLLNSDIKGAVENPNYYFLQKDTSESKKLDLLLMTQGWRKTELKKIISENTPPITYQPEKGLNISGTVTKGNKPIPNLKIYLYSNNGKIFAIDTITNKDGKFIFDNLFFTDSTKFMVKAGDEKRKFYEIKIDENPAQKITYIRDIINIETNVNETISAYLKNNDNYLKEMMRLGFLHKAINLKTVNITAKRTIVEESSNWNGPGNADHIATAEDLKKFATLSGYISTLFITGRGRGGSKVIVDGLESKPLHGDDPLETLNIENVASIEVLKSLNYTFVYGSIGSVIIITTKIGVGVNTERIYAPAITTTNPQGYYLTREFYMPKYNVADISKDFRTTVYWKPNVISGINGNLFIEYYNANETGKYRVVIEGIDADGNLGRKTFTYDVN